MSKMDGLRAMREARYEQQAARAGKAKAAPTRPASPTPTPAGATPDPNADASTATGADTGADIGGEQLCGHRAISGRTCTREQGHAAKSHRYS
jgi:hypothetical protein